MAHRIPALALALLLLVPAGTASAGPAPVTCFGVRATLVGTPGDDDLTGTPGDDVIVARGGRDTVRGLGGNDLICGGAGDDVMNAGGGDDRIAGGPGDDLIEPGSGDDVLAGGGGHDTVDYRRAPTGMLVDLEHRRARGWGNDRLRAVEGILGSGHADLLTGTVGEERIDGGDGMDRIDGAGGADVLAGGAGDDVVIGPGAAAVDGGAGTDACSGPAAARCETATIPAVLFVAPSGSDQAGGSTLDTALASIRAAVGRARPGTTVWVLRGRYREQISVEAVGRAGGDPVVLSGAGSPVLDGRATRALGFFCHGCDNVILQGFEVRGYTDIGAGATLSSGIVLRNLEVHHNGSAVQLVGWELEGYGIHVDSSSGVTIEEVDAHHNGPNPPVFPDRMLGTGINTYELTDATISNSRSFRNHGGGILVEDSVGVLVAGNEVFENDLDASAEWWWDGGLWVDGGGDVEIRDNVFRDNLGPGIEISDEEGQHPTGYVLSGNVSTGNHWGAYVWGFGTTDWPEPGVILRDGTNAFAGNRCGAVWFSPGSDFRTCP